MNLTDELKFSLFIVTVFLTIYQKKKLSINRLDI